MGKFGFKKTEPDEESSVKSSKSSIFSRSVSTFLSILFLIELLTSIYRRTTNPLIPQQIPTHNLPDLPPPQIHTVKPISTAVTQKQPSEPQLVPRVETTRTAVALLSQTQKVPVMLASMEEATDPIVSGHTMAMAPPTDMVGDLQSKSPGVRGTAKEATEV